jgi:hypothetical protein
MISGSPPTGPAQEAIASGGGAPSELHVGTVAAAAATPLTATGLEAGVLAGCGLAMAAGVGLTGVAVAGIGVAGNGVVTALGAGVDWPGPEQPATTAAVTKAMRSVRMGGTAGDRCIG